MSRSVRGRPLLCIAEHFLWYGMSPTPRHVPQNNTLNRYQNTKKRKHTTALSVLWTQLSHLVETWYTLRSQSSVNSAGLLISHALASSHLLRLDPPSPSTLLSLSLSLSLAHFINENKRKRVKNDSIIFQMYSGQIHPAPPSPFSLSLSLSLSLSHPPPPPPPSS